MTEDKVKVNSLRAWYLASRPKTLTGAMVPVIVACALAYSDGCFKLFPAVICAVFAGLMQIASNLINDLYDFLKGSDREDRLGPERATAMGWITPTAMRIGIIVVVSLACLAGCLLVKSAGLWLVAVGAVCVVFAYLYTAFLSYRGFGDVLVLVFFGLVPVCATYYLQAGRLSWDAVICATACGIVVDTLLVLNNFRDREADRKSGKRTLVVMGGEKFGLRLYLGLGIVGCALSFSLYFLGRPAAAIMPLLYLLAHWRTWRTMCEIRSGRALNSVLGMTSRNMFLYALLLAVGLLIH